MPKYKVTELSYIDNRLVQPGEIIEYKGKPGSKLEKVDSKGESKLEALVGDNLPQA